MNNIVNGIRGVSLPYYMEEILINNYCPTFIKMSMVRDNLDYRFCYQTEQYNILDLSALSVLDKLVLLRTIIIINERNEDWLIKAENYLIEPELIYSINNNVNDGMVRLLFYPDSKSTSFSSKLCNFANKLFNKRKKEEHELLDKIYPIIESGERNRVRMFLDKQIARIERNENVNIS